MLEGDMMKAPRYTKSRQKSCHQCSTAKAKCDRKREICTRCAQRGLTCTYSTFTTSGSKVNGEGSPKSVLSAEASLPSLGPEPSATVSHIGAGLAGSAGLVEQASSSALDFSDLDLICPINADDIRNRWLIPYVAGPGQQTKDYPRGVIRFIRRILSSYAAIASRGRSTLPFIHATQLKYSSPLGTCLSLVRVCENPLPGSENAAAAILQQEMEKLIELREGCDGVTLLAVFQAYLIYTMVLFFRLSQGSNDFFRRAVMNLQELASSASRKGLACTAERRRLRPRWEEWIICEAKRRTLFVMYLFDSVLSAQENLPTFLGTELRGLAAPAKKVLWEAQVRYEWEEEYNVYLAEWTEYLTIDELWPPMNMDSSGISQRQCRVDQWLEGIDEFGTMLFAVTTCTHDV